MKSSLTFLSTLSLILSVVFFLTNSSLSQTLTTTESLILKLQEQVKLLQSQIEELKSQVFSTKTELELVKTELKFTKALRLGTRGEEVTQLQEFLKQFPDIYPQGLVTGYYGPLTEAAVRKFQSKQGIDSIGVVGPKTLSKLNELVTEGAGNSGIIPPGLLIGPGLQKKLEPTATTTIPITPITPATTTPSVATTTPPVTATTTSTGTTPATPATSATPATPTSVSGAPTVSAIPATPAVPAVPAQPAQPASTAATSTNTIDTTPPSIPIGLVASNTSPDFLVYIRVSWTASTDNVGVIGYRIYRDGILVGSVSGTVYDNPAGLVARTTYSYTVAAYDAAGNVSAQSGSVSATTLSAQSSESAPTQITATAVHVGDYSSSLGGPTMEPRVRFNYSVKETTQSFIIYYKKSGDAAFTKYTFDANLYANVFSYSQGTSLYRYTYPNSVWQWEWQWDGIRILSQNVQLGQYQAYVTATDKNGIEGAPSATASFEIYAEPTIVNPQNGLVISSSTAPVFSISGNPASDYAYNSFAISKKNVYGFVWWCCLWSTVGPFTSAQGPILEPDDDPYKLTVYSRRTEDGVDASRPAIITFNVNASTAAVLNPRLQNLSAISQMLNSLDEILRQLSRILK